MAAIHEDWEHSHVRTFLSGPWKCRWPRARSPFAMEVMTKWLVNTAGRSFRNFACYVHWSICAVLDLVLPEELGTPGEVYDEWGRRSLRIRGRECERAG